MRTDISRSVGLAVAAAALVLMRAPAVGAEPQNSEQIVFSGGGSGTFNNIPTGFGFWIWCEGDASNRYVGRCNGSIYFYALGLTKGVLGGVTELDEGIYQMSVAARDGGGGVACLLTNAAEPTRGPTNLVRVECTAPAGSGSSPNAIVTVTGPKSEGEPIP
jgi:hypothetical protein